eukprot:20-Pyramimonas_sp.AAC.1
MYASARLLRALAYVGSNAAARTQSASASTHVVPPSPPPPASDEERSSSRGEGPAAADCPQADLSLGPPPTMPECCLRVELVEWVEWVELVEVDMYVFVR